MIDVDFRYVMRADPKLAEQMIIHPMIKVLQWRKRVHDPSRGYDDRFYWTDWQDVRTEEE